MTELRKWFNDELKKIAVSYTGKIINIGSGENDSYRAYFKNASEYKTLDPYCKNVDYAVISEIKDNSFDTVLCCWTLEHIFRVFDFINELHRICNEILIIAVPSNYRYHGAPRDYWRFTRDSMRELLKHKFEIQSYKEYTSTKEGGIMIVGVKK